MSIFLIFIINYMVIFIPNYIYKLIGQIILRFKFKINVY